MELEHLRLISRSELTFERRAEPEPDRVAEVARLMAKSRGQSAEDVIALVENQEKIPMDERRKQPAEMRAAYGQLPPSERDVLESTARRMDEFARAQRSSVQNLDVSVRGGEAGHRLVPVDGAGCLVPPDEKRTLLDLMGFTLQSKAAGVEQVWIASRNVSQKMLAAAHAVEADGMLETRDLAGLISFAFGADPLPSLDVIACVSNELSREETGLFSGHAQIMQMDRSRIYTIYTDGTGEPEDVARDIRAHSFYAGADQVYLVTTSSTFVKQVDQILERRAKDDKDSPEGEALKRGSVLVCAGDEEAIRLCNAISPSILRIATGQPEDIRDRFREAGCVLMGRRSGSSFLELAVGPAGLLPAREDVSSHGSLCPLDFLRVQTHLQVHSGISAIDLSRNLPVMGRMDGMNALAEAVEEWIATQS